MDRIALVIGNSEYQHVAKLKNPLNDANDIANILEKLNFKVIKKLNASLRDIQNAISSFLYELDDYAVGLLYYAGHGMQIDGENYIVPVDCAVVDKGRTIVSCYELSEYLRKLQAYKGKTNICILDACRDNPFTNGRDLYAGFTEFHNQPKGTIIAYSTSPDCTASDGSGSNGLYTQVLKDIIQIPNLKIEDMFKSVRIRVAELSGDTQISWEHSSLVGDFYFSVESMPVVSEYSDEEIYSYICSQAKYYETVTEDICDIECLPYVDAYKKYKMPVIKIMRAFSRIQYKKQRKQFSDATIDQLNYSYLTSWGFYQNYGRWYYKDSYVEMGDFLPLPMELSRPVPVSNMEIKIGGRATGELKDGKIRFRLYSNIPEQTPLIFTLKKGTYSAECQALANKKVTISDWFSKKGKALLDGHYRLEVSCLVHSLLPNEVKEIFGERNKNLVGRFIKFDPISGNTINFVFDLLIKNGEIIFFDR